LPAVQYLVDAARLDEPNSELPADIERVGRVGWVIELFERQMTQQRGLR
jgi:hypothetical protein